MNSSLLFLSTALLMLLLTMQNSNCRTTDFQVGVVLDLHSSDSPVGRIGKCCLSMSRSDFYRYHPDYETRLLLHFRDSNDSVVDAASAALDLVQDEKVDAIIGPQKSTQANFLMDLGDKAHIPIISFSATSPSLVPQTSYFVQTAQSDFNQVQAIASIVKAFHWNQVVIIYEDTDMGHGIMPHLCNALQDVNARVSYRSLIPRFASEVSISNELNIMMTKQTRIFLVHMSQSLGAKIFKKAKELGMMSEGYAWIVTSGMTDLFNLMDFDAVDAMKGVLGVRPLIPKSHELQLFSGRWIRTFIQDNHEMNPSETSIFCLWAYDTFTALAMAAERVGNSSSSATKNKSSAENHQGSFALEKSETGPKLLQALLDTRFQGLAGEFDVGSGQLKQTSYQIVNVVGKNEREVGIWSPSEGISAGLRTIIWPGETTVVPRGWEFPVSGKKLRIGVPEKPGFNEFLKVETDPQTYETKVSGYYKEVFESVMENLPYAMSFEYAAYPFFNPDGSRVGSYDDLVYQVSLQGKYDAALGDITITANRSIYADFTMPYAEGGIASIVPIKYEDVNDLLTFLKPLTKELWLTTASFYISTSLAVWILGSRVINRSRDSPGQHAGMICYFPFFPGEGFQRLIPTVTDMTQLIKNGDYVGCQEGSFLVTFLKNLSFQESRIRTYNSTENCVDALMLGSKNGGISAYYDVLPHIRMILSQYSGKYMIVGPIHRTDGFAFAFPKGSHVVADISRTIIQLTERGLIRENEQINSACLDTQSSSTPSSVTLRSFLVLFLITGFVTMACLVVSYINLSVDRALLLQRMSDFRDEITARIHVLCNFVNKMNPFSCPK